MNRHDRIIALHEAAHAVAALALGGRVRSVGALPAGRELGRVFWDTLTGPAEIIAILAGSAAVAVAGDPLAYEGANDDYGRAIGLLLDGRMSAPPALAIVDILPALRAAENEARRIVYRYGHEIGQGAAVLARRGFMTGPEFAAACGGQFADLAVQLHTAEPPPAPVFVIIDRCEVCGWQLPIPLAAAALMPAAELDLWRATLRGMLCYRPHGQGNE